MIYRRAVPPCRCCTAARCDDLRWCSYDLARAHRESGCAETDTHANKMKKTAVEACVQVLETNCTSVLHQACPAGYGLDYISGPMLAVPTCSSGIGNFKTVYEEPSRGSQL